MGLTLDGPVLLEADGLVKRFGATTALRRADLQLRAGERRAIMGENGAGKSTLMRMLAGLVVPDEGTIAVEGTPLASSSRAARDAGIALVHQELSLVPTLSVAENICLGAHPTRWGVFDRRAARRDAAELLETLEIPLDPKAIVERLSLADRQFVEIAKALRLRPRVLILDEPTASLSPREVDQLFQVVRRLTADGMGVLYISHRLSEVFDLCHTVTVLRDGVVVHDGPTDETTPDELIRVMVGRELATVRAEEADERSAQRESAAPVVVATGVTTDRIDDATFAVHEGEIVGVAGLVGSGRTELLRAAIGLDAARSGTVTLHGQRGERRVRHFADALAAGAGYVPEERRTEGLAIELSVAHNAAMPSMRDLTPGWILARGRARDLGRRVVEESGVMPAAPTLPVGALSGGNQQKVVLGKWLARSPRLLVLDEPTRGVDVGAKAEIHRLIRAATTGEQHAGVLVTSSELPELIDLCDRILVLRSGAIAGELRAGEATEERILAMASGLPSGLEVAA